MLLVFHGYVAPTVAFLIKKLQKVVVHVVHHQTPDVLATIAWRLNLHSPLLVAVCAILCKVDVDPSFNCLNYWVLLNILSIIEKYHISCSSIFHIVQLVLYFLSKKKVVLLLFFEGKKQVVLFNILWFSYLVWSSYKLK